MNSLKKYWTILRRIRLLHMLNNFANYSLLKKNKPLYKKYNIPKSVLKSISHKDFRHAVAGKPWLDSENSMEQLNKSDELKKFDPDTQQQLLCWPEKGYALLKGFVEPD
ncbi:MAG: hypothetical protein HYU69_05195, partial [Bacteroidetes bacterium]|nr:hypothetical protein [Bacteroidota bacterium]